MRLCIALCALFFAQSDPAPKFEVADVHFSPKGRNQLVRAGMIPRGGRIEIQNVSLVQLIQMAYGYPDRRILEGPNWIEMDRFDVTAKVPAGTSRETQNLMLQSLLEDRFKLVVRKENRPMPAYALVAGKKPLLKEANGSGDPGCKPKPAPAGPVTEGGMRMGINGVQIALGPGGSIEYNCRNITMADFAAGLRRMFGANDLGENPVTDDTGIKGTWNFDVHWSIGFFGFNTDGGPKITVAEAIEKQLGLKLEQRPVSTPVLVIESVNRQPTDNVPNISELLPPLKTPVEFEVADVKPAAPGGRGGGLRNQPGGRLTGTNVAMRQLLLRALNTFNDEALVGIPDWAGNIARFDIVAKAPAEPGQAQVDQQTMGLMIRSLLVDRFKLTWHTEERPMTTYALVAVKPKMKKADPKERANCTNEDPPAGAPPGSESLVCKDVTMDQFADALQGAAQGLNWPISNLTELEGGYDFTLTFSRFPQMAIAGPGRGGGDAAPADSPLPAASEPVNSVSIFEAVEKQLGLKLTPRKQNMPVTVIDHLEQKPTEN